MPECAAHKLPAATGLKPVALRCFQCRRLTWRLHQQMHNFLLAPVCRPLEPHKSVRPATSSTDWSSSATPSHGGRGGGDGRRA